MTLKFDLVSKQGCHLCEDFLHALTCLKVEMKLDFDCHVLDIQQDKALQVQFSDKIPVLLFQGEMVCHYYLVPEAVITLCQGR